MKKIEIGDFVHYVKDPNGPAYRAEVMAVFSDVVVGLRVYATDSEDGWFVNNCVLDESGIIGHSWHPIAND